MSRTGALLRCGGVNQGISPVFVWVFHRVSGVLLILFLAVQLLTGFYQASVSNSEWVATMADLHRHMVVKSLLVFLVIFHALYGVRTILMDLGVNREKLLFWVCTGLGIVLFLAFLISYSLLVAA